MRFTLAGMIALSGLSAHCATTDLRAHTAPQRPSLVATRRATVAAPIDASTDDAELDRQIAAVRERDARDSGRGEWSQRECLRAGTVLSSIASSIRHERRADAWFAAAMVFQRCELTERETAALERALAMDHDHCGASTRRAVLLDREGSTETALSLLGHAPIACVDAQLESGRIRLAHLDAEGPGRARALQSATNAALAAMRFDSEHPMALNVLARVYLERARDSSLREPYTTAEQTSDRAIAAQRRRGIDGPSARAVLAEAFNVRGLAQLAKERVANAFDSFRGATEYAPNAFEPWMNLGLVALGLRDYDGAQRALATAVPLATTSEQQFDSRLALGVALRGLGRIDRAIGEYEAALRIAPDRPEPLFNLALLHGQYAGGDMQEVLRAGDFARRFRQRVEERGQQARFAAELDSARRLVDFLACGMRCMSRSSFSAVMNSAPPPK